MPEKRLWHDIPLAQRERLRVGRLCRDFRLTLEEYEELLQEQHGRCAACGEGETRLKHGKVQNLCVDHDHVTGFVRGLLCDSCNLILGRAKDSPERLRRLAAYLEVAEKRQLRSETVDSDGLLAELKGDEPCLRA